MASPNGGASTPSLTVREISYPAGGGAIRGMDESFTSSDTGSARLSVPLPVTPARGFEPELRLDYDSRGGNGPWGVGFALSLPYITVRPNPTPRYDGREGFTLFGAGPLVPLADSTVRTTLDGAEYDVTRYRPRVETDFSRIEQWREADGDGSFWRILGTDNRSRWLGRTPRSRIADPADPSRIFQWLLDAELDARGNAILYLYKEEDGVNVPRALYERNRVQTAMRYLDRALYGNASAVLTPAEADALPPEAWHFAVVFDYGQYDVVPANDDPWTPARPWAARSDPFSTYAAGFEIRTHRLCRNVLLFHRFDEIGPRPALTRAVALTYDDSPALAKMTEIVTSGWQYDGAKPAGHRYRVAALPPLALDYVPFQPQGHAYEPLRALDGGSPRDLDRAPFYNWADLYGEGVPGVLYADDMTALYWSRRMGATPEEIGLAPVRAIDFPNGGPVAGERALVDLDADGRMDVLVATPSRSGVFAMGADERWQPFRPFVDSVAALAAMPVEYCDLANVGQLDAVQVGRTSVTWYPSEGFDGFGAAKVLPASGLPVTAGASQREVVLFADLLGAGTPQRVRIASGRVECWPSLGYGRFAPPVELENAPRFGDEVPVSSIFLADVDGTGAADLAIARRDRVEIYRNRGGNSFAAEPLVVPLPGTFTGPSTGATSQLFFADVFGIGCTSLVFSRGGPGPKHVVYDFCRRRKPYLLSRVANGAGASTSIEHASAVQYYLEDQRDGRPWRTRIPFPIQVVRRTSVDDPISGTRTEASYAYHDGQFDSREGEFRGFARIEEVETRAADARLGGFAESLRIAAGAPERQPPKLTKRWFLVGWLSDDDLEALYRRQYFDGDAGANPLPLGVIDWNGQPYDADTLRQAWNALAGSLIHEEVYGLDGSPAQGVPYTVRDACYRAKLLQTNERERSAIFAVEDREEIEYEYERVANDPRTTQTYTLAHDDFGNVLAECTVWYPRRKGGVEGQDAPRALGTRNEWLAPLDTPGHLVAGLLADTRRLELTNLPRPAIGGRYYAFEQIEQAMSGSPAPVLQRLTRRQSFFYAAEGGGEAPPGTVTPQALLLRTAELAYDAAALAEQYAGVLDAAQLADLLAQEGGFTLADGFWWDPGVEQAYLGLEDFFVPSSARDPFARAALRQGGTTTRYIWDAHRFVVTATTLVASHGDVLDATRRIAKLDYRSMKALQVIDENGVAHEAFYDPLGMVFVQSMHGRERDGGGAHPAGFTPLDFARQDEWPRPASVAELLADPARYVRGAQAFFFYDFGAFERGGTPPVSVAARAPRYPDPAAPDQTVGEPEIQLVYADGGGRVVQRSSKVEPAPGDPAPRWLVMDRVRYNSAGNPFRIYEPFYAATSAFIPGGEVGAYSVSPLFHYDAVDRVVRTEYPRRPFDDAFFSQNVYEPWSVTAYDVDDTVKDSVFYDYYIVQGHPLPENEKNALLAAAQFFDTPATSVFDNQGNVAQSIERLEPGVSCAPLVTRSAYDVEGSLLGSADPRLGPARVENVVFTYGLDGSTVVSASCDRGTTHVLPNVFGAPVFVHDARGTVTRTSYDSFHRSTITRARMSAGGEKTVVRAIYGDSLDPAGSAPFADEDGRNVRGRVCVLYDPGGREETPAFTIRGDLQRQERRLAIDYKSEPDWQASGWTTWSGLFAALDPLLQTTVYGESAAYDALSRVLSATDAAGNVLEPTYFVSGREDQARWTPAGGSRRAYVTATEYDPRGQPLAVDYGDAGSATFLRTRYGYDPDTLRLTSLVTAKTAAPDTLQSLAFWYDPVGNLMHVEDAAAPLPLVFHGNQKVTPERDYTYDPLYRLVAATGRSLKGLTAADERTGSYAPFFRGGGPAALERYRATYRYDTGGNLDRLTFASPSSSWTTEVTIAAKSNRGAEVSAGRPVDDYFDACGNQIRLDGMAPILWSYRNEIARVTLVERVTPFDDAQYYVQAEDGTRLRKVTETLVSGRLQTDETIYFPTLEIFRRTLGGTVVEERQRARILHGGECVAERIVWTVGSPPAGVPAEQSRYQLGDDLGVALEVDDTGALVSYEEYAPYGATTFAAGKSLKDVDLKEYRYSRKERDPVTGLYDYGARTYIPWTGRWMSPDPAGFVDGLNLYAFVVGNPASRLDEQGYANRQKQPRKTTTSTRRGRGRINTVSSGGVKKTRTKTRQTVRATRGRYLQGMHGFKTREQKRLKAIYKIPVTGTLFESEHTIGFEPLARGSGLVRNKGSVARSLENLAPAYQEYKPLHRAHIGTGTRSQKDASGFNSEIYRATQRQLIQDKDVSSAVQINQLGYAFDKTFRSQQTEVLVADASYDTMIENMSQVQYAVDSVSDFVKVDVDAVSRAEMYLARRAARTGQWPSQKEIDAAKKLFGVPIKPQPSNGPTPMDTT